jgi:hypothetical protein
MNKITELLAEDFSSRGLYITKQGTGIRYITIEGLVVEEKQIPDEVPFRDEVTGFAHEITFFPAGKNEWQHNVKVKKYT